MADAKKDAKKDDEKKYSMIPGKPVFIVGMLGIVFGYFQMYPEHLDGFLKKFERSGAVASLTPVVKVERKVIKRVEVSPEWSDDWTTLPPGGNYSLIHPNRSFDLLFENGEIRSYDDDGKPKDRDPLPGNRFRLRGMKGTLEIVEDTQ